MILHKNRDQLHQLVWATSATDQSFRSVFYGYLHLFFFYQTDEHTYIFPPLNVDFQLCLQHSCISDDSCIILMNDIVYLNQRLKHL